MKNKNIFSLSLKNIFRNKKRTIITILLFSILFTILLMCLTFKNTLTSFVNDYYYKSYGNRVYTLNMKYDEIDVEEIKEKLNSIDGLGVFENSQRISLTSGSLKLDNVTTISLHGANNETLPKIIAGTNFSDDEFELICPIKLFTASGEEFFSTEYIDMNAYLNKDLIVSINEFNLSSPSREVIDTHDFSIKIVGLYDAQANQTYSDQCFTKFEFIEQINQINDYGIKDNSLFIVIDDYNNYDDIYNQVKDKLNGISFSMNPTQEMDSESIESILTIVLFACIITFVICILCQILLISKNIKKRSSEIGTYQSFGYNKNSVVMMFIFENLILVIISFIIAFLITSGIIAIIINLAKTKYIGLLNFSFSLPLFQCIIVIAFALISILTTFISFRNKQIASLLRD